MKKRILVSSLLVVLMLGAVTVFLLKDNSISASGKNDENKTNVENPASASQKVSTPVPEMTYEQSVARGLTVHRIEELSDEQNDFLAAKIAELDQKGVCAKFDKLLEEWMEEAYQIPLLIFENEAFPYYHTPKAAEMMSFIKENDPDGYLTIYKYVQAHSEAYPKMEGIGHYIEYLYLAYLTGTFSSAEYPNAMSDEADENKKVFNAIAEKDNQEFREAEHKEDGSILCWHPATYAFDFFIVYLDRKMAEAK